MYSIVMNKNKYLQSSTVKSIFQRENMVDKLQFIIPKEYDEFDLSLFTPVLTYINSVNETYSETLILEDDNYKENFLAYVLPVDTSISAAAGNVKLRLSLVYVDLDTRNQYVLNTSEYTLTVTPLTDYFSIDPNKSLDALNQKIIELDVKLQEAEFLSSEFAKNQVDDLKLTDDLLQVSVKGVAKGTGVNILNPTNPDQYDEDPNDGIIDLGDIIEI